MKQMIEKLEKLMSEAEGKPDYSLEVLDYSEALRKCAPLLLEIVKAAKALVELHSIDDTCKNCLYDINHVEQLLENIERFEESEL